MGKIRLRAHHLICLQNFEGKGYSQAFVENMQRVVNCLKEHPEDDLICVVEGGDDLCSCCPFYQKNKCSAFNFVEQLDRSYAPLFPKKMSYHQLKMLTNKQLDAAKFESICKHCEWWSVCCSKIKP